MHPKDAIGRVPKFFVVQRFMLSKSEDVEIPLQEQVEQRQEILYKDESSQSILFTRVT